MYLKYIEHSAENLEFYVWCVPSTNVMTWLANRNGMNRFKNYENGRLTAFPDLPRAVTPLDGKSFTDSEKSLAKAENDDKFSKSSINDSESQENIYLENGESFTLKHAPNGIY